MSLSDIKHSLRKHEFPICAKEALNKIEQLLSGRVAPSSKQMDMAIDIISEFIFCEGDRRMNRRNGLSALQELQLIDIICEYLSSCSNETIKNMIFLSLFGGPESNKRLKLLSILASVAVSASCTPVLLAVGVWLQQTGCSSPQSRQLAENIIRDHFQLNPTNRAILRSIASTAPQFVANFIAAVTELYMQGVQESNKLPPENLLEVITCWVFENPLLCMSAQTNPAALPSGCIPMSVVTPLAGLIYLCAIAPLYVTDVPDVEMEEIPLDIKRIKLENQQEPPKIVSERLTEAGLYTKLHLGVLQSLRAVAKPQGSSAISAQHIGILLPVIQKYAQQLAARGISLHNHPQLQDCLDRLGQAVQVALANGCMYGNINSLLAALDKLPDNRLLSIVINTHQTTMQI